MSVPVISIARMREWENATWKTGQTETEVIRRVGQKLARLTLRLTKPHELVVAFAGRGNNGADARAMLDVLDERRVDVLQVRDPDSDFAELETLLALRPALIVDGLFGIGINRPLDAAWIRFIERINEAKLQVLCVDVPSGLNADTGEPEGAAVRAAVTLTVGAPKEGLLRSAASPYVGRLEVATDVGLTPCPFSSGLNWTMPEDFDGFPPRRPVTMHKGDLGHLGILAGSAGYHGAGVLAARSAQRARPGLITLLPHSTAYMPCAAQLQAVMVQPWSPNAGLPGDYDALLIGPGLAAAAAEAEFKEPVVRIWSSASIPVVADASALAWLPPGPVPEDAIRVITPHPGEAARLLGITSAEVQADRPQALRTLSARYGDCWVILKGHQTLVGRSAGDLWVNSSGNPHLAQGGAGDVLAGFLAGLIAQPVAQGDVLRTLRLAVWQHGAAADRLQETQPNWVVEDLVKHLNVFNGNG